MTLARFLLGTLDATRGVAPKKDISSGRGQPQDTRHMHVPGGGRPHTPERRPCPAETFWGRSGTLLKQPISKEESLLILAFSEQLATPGSTASLLSRTDEVCLESH